MAKTAGRIPNLIRESVSIIIGKAGQTLNPNRADIIIPSGSTSDEDFINNAINDLPTSGGVIVLLDGTYTIDGSINLVDNAILEGNGAIIKIIDNVSSSFNIMDIDGVERVRIRSIIFDGNKTNRVSGTQRGIDVDNTSESAIEFCIITDINDHPLLLGNSEHINISNCVFDNTNTTAGDDCDISSGCQYVNVFSCTFLNSPGNAIFTNTDNHIIQSNRIFNPNIGIATNSSEDTTIVSNAIFGAADRGISLFNSPKCSVTNNKLINCNIGLRAASGSDECILVSNKIDISGTDSIILQGSSITQITGNTITESGEHGILMSSSNNNCINSNLIVASGQSSDNTYDGINLSSDCDDNNIQLNKIFQGSTGTLPRYGINISVSSCDDNYVTNNDLKSSGSTGEFNDNGTNTVTTPGNRT